MKLKSLFITTVVLYTVNMAYSKEVDLKICNISSYKELEDRSVSFQNILNRSTICGIKGVMPIESGHIESCEEFRFMSDEKDSEDITFQYKAGHAQFFQDEKAFFTEKELKKANYEINVCKKNDGFHAVMALANDTEAFTECML